MNEPPSAEASFRRGVALRDEGRHAEAAEAFTRAIALAPASAEAHSNLGNALRDAGRPEAAIDAYRRALALRPDFLAACYNLGIVLAEQHRHEEAADMFRRAIALRPVFANGHYNLGMASMNSGRIEDAVAAFRATLRLQQDHPGAHANLGICLLTLGRLAEGWAEYEWRWRVPEMARTWPRWPQPTWDGGDPAGRTILAWSEQGFGDTIHFARYVPLLRARGARVVMRVPAALRRLLRHLPDAILSHGDALPAFDAHASLMSLPRLLGADGTPPAAAVPYVFSRAPLALGDGLKIGLVWSGNPAQPHNRERAIPFALLAPLLEMPDIRWFGLQLGEHAADAASASLTDLSPGLGDFQDTADAIAGLDLVIGIDTAVAHLAGAMGRPVLLLLSANPDWRWHLDRDDSPWYPTMRLFRQPAPGQWAPVVQRVAAELRDHERRSSP